jgi:hypothetical protein
MNPNPGRDLEIFAKEINDKVTPELFKNAGVAPAEPLVDELVRHQPILSKAEILRQGREGMVQLSRGNDWASWKKVLPVLGIARSAAMLEANTNQPKGRRYCDAFGKWFRCHREFEVLGKLDKGTRAHFFESLAELEAIDKWRTELPLEQQFKLNYPTTILTHWKKHCAPVTPPGAPKNEPVEAPLDPVAVWATFSNADKTKILDSEGRVGLAKIASSGLLADLVDHVVAQQIKSMPGPNMKLKTYAHGALTKILWRIIGAAKENDTSAVSTACAGRAAGF